MPEQISGGPQSVAKLRPQGSAGRPSNLRSVRFYVMAIALISPFVTTYSRTIINFAITDMIDPCAPASQPTGELQEDGADQSSLKQVPSTCPEARLNNNSFITGPENSALKEDLLPYFDTDQSCPVTDPNERQRLMEEAQKDTKRATSQKGEKFQWDTFKQGLLKAAFAIGHTMCQIPGSRLSEIYGSHKIMCLGLLLMALSCLSAPFLASANFYLLFADLILLGCWGSFMTPALITLFSNWLTPSEKSIMMSFYLIASRLGYALSSLLCGLLIQAQYSWRHVFFSAGLVSLTYSVLFMLGARNRPSDHPLVTGQELDYLASKNTLVRESLAEAQEQRQLEATRSVQSPGDQSLMIVAPKKRSRSAPWLKIMTNVPVLAFIITKFCVKLAGDTLQIELPVYLKRVMHFSARDNGLLNAANYVIFCVGCALVGAISTWVNKSRPLGINKTTSRKLFQGIGSFGASLSILGLAYSVCDNTWTMGLLFLQFFITTFSVAGEAQMPMDLSERYSGTIHAIGSSLAISGIIEPTLVGYLMTGKAANKDAWKGVWLGASAVAMLGGLVFTLFADANIQPFDRIDDREPDEPRPASDGQENKAYVKNDSDDTTGPTKESAVI